MISFPFGRNKITPGIRVEDELKEGKVRRAKTESTDVTY